MNQIVLSKQRYDYTPEDGMLFVRTTGILTTMVQIPLIVVSLVVIALTFLAQNSFGATKSLDLTIYPDGTTHVFSEVSVDPQDPEIIVNLLGVNIDNFVVQDENGILLSAQIDDSNAIVKTLGASSIIIDYDTHDLVSKEGRIWSFDIDSPIDYTLLMPPNTVIVGMNTYPINMQILDDQSQLYLPRGKAEINYFFGVAGPLPPQQTETTIDNSLIFLGGGIAAGGAVVAVVLNRLKRKSNKITEPAQKLEEKKSLDVETILKREPHLREDDKEIVSFISANGGQAFESELRKKFLQPRTTMWRAVKRLERYGIVEIEKKELQNLVKLKEKLEDES